MLMRAATVVQVLQDLFYVLLACFILLMIAPLKALVVNGSDHQADLARTLASLMWFNYCRLKVKVPATNVGMCEIFFLLYLS